MNNYPVWWEQDLTVYNRYEDPTTHVITWYRHNLSNCFWNYDKNIVRVEDIVLETNRTICRIPKNAKFKEQYEWVNLSNDTMSSYWTLGIGDIIVKGNVTDDIDEYTPNHRSSDLITKYRKLQGCMQIEVVAINTGAGRCNEHYYVSGN